MIFKREPALILGLVQTVLALVLAFGVEVTSEQAAGILAVTAAVLALVTRQVVYAPSTVDEVMDADAIIGEAERNGSG